MFFATHYHASICKHHLYTVRSPTYTYQSHQLDLSIGYCTDCNLRWAAGQNPLANPYASKYDMDNCLQGLQQMTVDEQQEDITYVGPTYLQKAHTLDNADIVYDSIEGWDGRVRQDAVVANEGRRAPTWSIETSSMAPGSGGFRDGYATTSTAGTTDLPLRNAAYASNAAYESAVRSTLFEGPCATPSPSSSSTSNGSGQGVMDEEYMAARYAALSLLEQGDELAKLRDVGRALIAQHGAGELAKRMDGMSLE